MGTDTVVYILMGVCLLVIVLFVFSKPLKLLLKIAINSALGILALIGMNFLLSPLSVSVGINALTVIIVGVLGFPGFLCLYLSTLLL